MSDRAVKELVEFCDLVVQMRRAQRAKATFGGGDREVAARRWESRVDDQVAWIGSLDFVKAVVDPPTPREATATLGNPPIP